MTSFQQELRKHSMNIFNEAYTTPVEQLPKLLETVDHDILETQKFLESLMEQRNVIQNQLQ
jgi:hypothetical protein